MRLILAILTILIMLMEVFSLTALAGEKENLYKRAGMLEERMQQIQEKAVLAQSELTQIYQRIGQIEAQEKADKEKENKK